MNKEEDVEKIEHDIEEIFEEVGQFGKYQLFIFILVGFTASLTALTAYSYIFVGGEPQFR
jgi:hypothetical protein